MLMELGVIYGLGAVCQDTFPLSLNLAFPGCLDLGSYPQFQDSRFDASGWHDEPRDFQWISG